MKPYTLKLRLLLSFGRASNSPQWLPANTPQGNTAQAIGLIFIFLTVITNIGKAFQLRPHALLLADIFLPPLSLVALYAL